MSKRKYIRGINRMHYVELRTQNCGKDYQELKVVKGQFSDTFGNLSEGESKMLVKTENGKITRKAIDIDKCSTRSNKTNKIVRTQQSIDNKINGISQRVEISQMDKRQKRKYYAQLNK